jgi:hypothetical protein
MVGFEKAQPSHSEFLVAGGFGALREIGRLKSDVRHQIRRDGRDSTRPTRDIAQKRRV